ncbi:MAG: hypothetical protein ACRDBO_03570 [Lachnospiraceae bacterium]
MYVSGYVRRPIEPGRVQMELENLRVPKNKEKALVKQWKLCYDSKAEKTRLLILTAVPEIRSRKKQ